MTGNTAQLADPQLLAELSGEFVETAGKDYVEFRTGSSVLDPAAQFRLERQALWLRAYPMIAVRLTATGDGQEQIADRRLAMARGSAVQSYLMKWGVRDYQITGIDVAPAPPRQRQRVSTRIDVIQPAASQ